MTPMDNLHFGMDPSEIEEWLESLEDVLHRHGPEKTQHLLAVLESKASESGAQIPFRGATPYVNTIPVEKQPRFPGSREIDVVMPFPEKPKNVLANAGWEVLARD